MLSMMGILFFEHKVVFDELILCLSFRIICQRSKLNKVFLIFQRLEDKVYHSLNFDLKLLKHQSLTSMFYLLYLLK